jgi:large subunit ribosomal protein L18
MTALVKKQQRAKQRQKRVRGKLLGTAQRPRLTVFRSNKNTYLQVINDEAGKTIASANDLQMAKKDAKAMKGTKTERAQKMAEELVSQLKKLKVTKLCFDRGSYRYHGRLKAVADVVREAGIQV